MSGIRFAESLKAWGTPDFEAVLKQEIEALGAAQLPLQQGLSTSSYALDNKPSVMILDVAGDGDVIRAKVGVFFSGIIAGCSCADDPTPVDEVNEYCEMQFVIDRNTGLAIIEVLAS